MQGGSLSSNVTSLLATKLEKNYTFIKDRNLFVDSFVVKGSFKKDVRSKKGEGVP